MKWSVLAIIFLLACNNEVEETQITSDSITRSDSIIQTEDKKNDANSFLIIPGESIGDIELGMDAAGLEEKLGQPTTSDAAMGKAWMTWQGKKDEHNNKTETNVYTSYSDNTMKKKTVHQVRTSSPDYMTADSLKVNSPLSDIKNIFPAIVKTAHYNSDGRDIIIYDEKEKGIAFEIVSANKQDICVGVIVHREGEPVTEIYRFLRTSLKNY